MKIFLLKESKLLSYTLPEKVGGSFELTEIDNDGYERNIITIEAINNEWRLVSNADYYVTDKEVKVSNIPIVSNSFYVVSHSYSANKILLFTLPTYESMTYYSCNKEITFGITIGRSPNTAICIDTSLIPDLCATIKVNNNGLSLINNAGSTINYGIYVNDKKVDNETTLNLGDVIFIFGVRLLVCKKDGNYVLGLTNPYNNIKIFMTEMKMDVEKMSYDEPNDEVKMEVYKREDYFYRKPRFIYEINPISIGVDTPPNKLDGQDMPMILTIGPMMTMALTSVMTFYNTFSKIQEGTSNYKQAMPSLIMSGAMLLSFLLWPLITNRYQKHQRKKAEKGRKVKYGEYIDSIKTTIQQEKDNQTNIMNQRFVSLDKCKNIILNKEDRLWERRKYDTDFLNVSIGFGNLPLDINLKFPEDHFSLKEDVLIDKVNELKNSQKQLTNVPIPFDLKENYITAIIGNRQYQNIEIKSFLLQLCTFHSYEDLKICIFTNKEKAKDYNFIKDDNHIWNNEKTFRYFATNEQEYKEASFQLDKVFSSRAVDDNREYNIADEHGPLYVFIVDSIKRTRNIDLFNKILEYKQYVGISMIILNDRISDLPDQCQAFIEVNDTNSVLSSNSSSSINQQFIVDKTIIDYDRVFTALSNIPLEIKDEGEFSIPKKVGFLEMYNISKIESFNSKQRWIDNVPIHSLAVPVGIGNNGEKINLDLHEKFHGPHGLIAGMTGSGKSEFIITYILSLAVNYNPEEVQFILIDYKGGGLAGAFENQTTGIKLPHLVGTITNLDKNEINRSLSSIESELKRRQALFNKAREASEESTIDIYKYQEMYRNHQINEPVSHLFIIADEFAELKNQQPEFMEQLISTARIGRSLGVHLILATQKPSGVVDSQIWSNTRFRVCLRVQEKSDSTEVIKRPDAAYLTQTGRFYFQVGFNEIFTLGQSAWTGGKYNPNEIIKKNIDTSVDFVNNIGFKIKSIQSKVQVKSEANYGEELINIVKYLSNLANEEGIHPKPLWLSRIPENIYAINLIKKYAYKKEPFVLNPVVGEYDLPQMQMQQILTVPFTNEGNVLLYGTAGSGKENFITTMIFSSMIIYTPLEVNYYIMDFGSEALRYFKSSPYVGDIMSLNDTEKIENLYKMIQSEIENRKSLFKEYNGSYSTYCKTTGNTIPNIVIIINNFEAYIENYSEHEDMLNMLTRECTKYGIYFLIAATTANGVRFKLKQNFGKIFSLQLNNEEDYSTVLGNVKKVYPSRIFGRGIFKPDNTYEFQTALATTKEEIPNFIKQCCLSLKDKYKVKAKKVPILPEIVSLEDCIDDVVNINDVALGINKLDLKTSIYDFTKNPITAVTSNDITLLENPIKNIITQINNKPNTINIVINAEGFELGSDIESSDYYYKNNYDQVFDLVTKFIEDSSEAYKQNNFDRSIFKDKKRLNVTIIGINSFKNRLSADKQTVFDKLFTGIQDLGVINYIFVDTLDKFKKLSYDAWFKDNFDSSSGIYLGNGLNEQIILNTSRRIPEMKIDVPNGFGFVINRGNPTYVKFIEKI